MLGGLDKGWEGIGLMELCVESTLCNGNWLEAEMGWKGGDYCVDRKFFKWIE